YDGEDTFKKDDIAGLTQGLLWANENKVPKDYARGRLKGLRDWGYVFWDSWRLKASGVLDKRPQDVAQYQFNEKARKWSVSERLKDQPERQRQNPSVFEKKEPKPPTSP
ncbi:MAG: hypothetical protein Q9224_007115, partial [Gallowayella concinna]